MWYIYQDKETGYEKWEKDLNLFITEEFQNKLNSFDEVDHIEAFKKISIFEISTNFSYCFNGTCYKKKEKKIEVVKKLKYAKSKATNCNSYSKQMIDDLIENIEIEIECGDDF